MASEIDEIRATALTVLCRVYAAGYAHGHGDTVEGYPRLHRAWVPEEACEFSDDVEGLEVVDDLIAPCDTERTLREALEAQLRAVERERDDLNEDRNILRANVTVVERQRTEANRKWASAVDELHAAREAWDGSIRTLTRRLEEVTSERDGARAGVERIGSALFQPATRPSLVERILLEIEGLYSERADRKTAEHHEADARARAERAERERDNTSAAIAMIGSELCGDPKIDATDTSDPRWTPTLQEAAKLRAQLAKVRADLDAMIATHDEVERERDELKRRVEATPPWPEECGVFMPLDEEQFRALRLRWSTGPEQYQADADALIATALHARRERDEAREASILAKPLFSRRQIEERLGVAQERIADLESQLTEAHARQEKLLDDDAKLLARIAQIEAQLTQRDVEDSVVDDVIGMLRSAGECGCGTSLEAGDVREVLEHLTRAKAEGAREALDRAAETFRGYADDHIDRSNSFVVGDSRVGGHRVRAAEAARCAAYCADEAARLAGEEPKS